jgi:hypothetical protein
VGLASSTFFKKIDQQETKIGQGIFNRRTQSGSTTNSIMGVSQSHMVLPAYLPSDDTDQSSTTPITLEDLRAAYSQSKQQQAEAPSARTVTPKPAAPTLSYMN